MALTNPMSATFLSALSAEIRNEVYYHVLSKNKNIFFTVTDDGSDIRVERTSLQNVNQQLRREFGSFVLQTIRDKTWVFTDPSLLCALLDSAPEELSEIKKLKLQFSVGDALGFFSAKETFQFKDPETACEDFGYLSGLQTLEIVFERDEDEEAYHEEWEDYEGAIKEVVRRMRGHTPHLVGIVFSGDFDGEWILESEGEEGREEDVEEEDGQVSNSGEKLSAEEGERQSGEDEELEE